MRKHAIQIRWALGPVLIMAAAIVLLLSLSLVTSPDAIARPHGHKHSQGHKKKKKRAKARKASAPLSGIYDACSYSTPKLSNPLPNCDDRLAVLRQGGFQVVLNYWIDERRTDEALRYAHTAEALGMKVIWHLATYRDGTQSRPIGPKLDFVRATKDLPATWGYYIGDEHPEYLPEVAELSRAIRSITNRPLLYVSRPNPSKLRPFKGLADYVGPDDYPVGPIDPSICQTARWGSRMVKRNFTMVLQAYSWSIDFPTLSPSWPDAAQMRQMRNQATRCGHPKLLMWFCFHCITDYNPTPDSYWRQVAWAANGANLGPNYRITSAG